MTPKSETCIDLNCFQNEFSMETLPSTISDEFTVIIALNSDETFKQNSDVVTILKVRNMMEFGKEKAATFVFLLDD